MKTGRRMSIIARRRGDEPMNPDNSSRSHKVVGLFLAATLTLTPGCSRNPFSSGSNDSFCADENNDGYCDQDGRPVTGSNNRSYRSGGWWGLGHYWGGGGSSGTNTGVSTGGTGSRGVSSGSKSGIGSSSRSGGSSGGSSGG